MILYTGTSGGRENSWLVIFFSSIGLEVRICNEWYGMVAPRRYLQPLCFNDYCCCSYITTTNNYNLSPNVAFLSISRSCNTYMPISSGTYNPRSYLFFPFVLGLSVQYIIPKFQANSLLLLHSLDTFHNSL